MNFAEQSERFLTESQARKRNPIKTATVAKYRSSLAHALPLFGHLELAQIGNKDLKALVAKLSADGLAASTIIGVVVVVKEVIASALDAEGNQLYPRTWNNDFIDLPTIMNQKSPAISPEAVQKAIAASQGRDKALVALLAGTGLRIGEALALEASDWDKVNFTLSVTKTVIKGRIQSSTKTEAGRRVVDLAPELNTFLAQNLPNEGLLFPSQVGGLAREMTLYEHLNKLGIPGFHSLRRYRVTHLRKSGVPEGLVQFWAGHRGSSITDRYDKIAQDATTRKEWAIKAGLGFELLGIL
jgi:integrase